MSTKMTLEAAKEFLKDKTRCELRDHAFGDREVTWYDSQNREVGEGYFGGGQSDGCSVTDPATGVTSFFKGAEARELSWCGKLVEVERNDETGPDEYRDGLVMPGLTLEGVRKELTGG